MPSPRHLVIVLPGIGGSVLARSGRPDQVVWDAGKGDIADLLVRPGRLSLAERLEPIGLTRSTKLLGFTLIPGYERLLTDLESFGKVDRGDPRACVPDADVVAVPYDFRYSVAQAAQHLDAVVSKRLAGLTEQEKAARVIVVAHSLGGLVARYWLGPLGQERWRWCRALITLGTPHRGAPKALDWLVNGVRVRGVPLPGPTRLVREWASVTELAPRYPAVRNLAVPAKDPNAAWYPHDLPIEWLAKPARDAYDLHGEIERAWEEMPRSGPEVVACLGWSHPTPDAAFWDGRRLVVRKEAPDWLDLVGWDKDFGDGTVPAVSALPLEMDNHTSSLKRLLDRHVPMACSPTVLDLLQRYEGWLPPRPVRGPEDQEHPPALGLDLDELHATGDQVAVAATLREVDADVSGQAVWATLRPLSGSTDSTGSAAPPPGRSDARLEWDPGRACFHGMLPGQAPGLYEVRVSAREVPGAGSLSAVDTIAVIADEVIADEVIADE